jgi:hypothetical protein
MRLLEQSGFELMCPLSTYGSLTPAVRITIFLLASGHVEPDLNGVTKLRYSNSFHSSASVSQGFWRDDFEGQ